MIFSKIVQRFFSFFLESSDRLTEVKFTKAEKVILVLFSFKGFFFLKVNSKHCFFFSVSSDNLNSQIYNFFLCVLSNSQISMIILKIVYYSAK